MGAEGKLLQKIAVVQQQSIIGAEDLLIGHPLGTQETVSKISPLPSK